MKYLGVKIDETLSGKGIIDTILKKCNGRIKFLYRQARCFPTALKKTLCQSLIQSHVDYAISSWYTAMSKVAKNKLQIIQNKMIRVATEAKSNSKGFFNIYRTKTRERIGPLKTEAGEIIESGEV